MTAGRWPLLAALVVATCVACGPSRGVFPPPAASLRAGEDRNRKPAPLPAPRALTAGNVAEVGSGSPRHLFYSLVLCQGQFLHLAAEQRGVDVKLILHDPAGAALVSVDSPNSEWGPEDLFFIAGRAGSYQLEIRQLSAVPGGRCTIRLAELRAPTPADRLRAAASHAASDGDAALDMSGGDVRRQGIKSYEEAARTWHALGDSEREALAEYKLGTAWNRLGEVRPAVSHWERALALLREHGIEDTVPALRNDLGKAYRRLGDAPRARASYASARDGARRLGDRREAAAALTNLGDLEESSGRPESALADFALALAAWREVGDEAGEAGALDDEGILYTAVGKLPDALDALQRSAALAHSAANRRQEALALMDLGWTRCRAGDAAAGRRDLLHALEIQRAARDRRGEGMALDRLGLLERASGDLAHAASHDRQALAIFRQIGDLESAARTLSNLGDILLAAGDAAAALRSDQEALDLLAPLGQPAAQAYARFHRAQAERALGRLAAARRDMEESVAALEGVREQARGDDLRMSYLESIHDLYEALIDLLMELHAKDPALHVDRAALAVAERSRARSLLDLVTAPPGMGRPSSDAASERLRAVDARIRAAEAALPPPTLADRQGAGRQASEAALGSETARFRPLLAERQRILVELRRERGVRSLAPHLLGAEEIAKQIVDAETAVLAYALGEQRSFVWALTTAGIESAVLPPRATIESAARRYHDLMANSRMRGAVIQAALTGREISTLLLGPVAKVLAHRRIAVMADSALAYVPFETLPVPGGDGAPLLAEHEVVMLPSASVLLAVRERAARRTPAPRLLAVLADPALGAAGGDLAASPGAPGSGAADAMALAPGGPSVARAARDLGLRGLAPLPFSRREGDSILALVPPGQGFEATGAGASYDLATGGQLAHFRILHLATHALIHPTTPELSGIVLSSVDEHGAPRPSFLSAYEVSELHLPADLVVLSACRTGLGRELRGEGLLGLTQSFFEAGATRVVVSLWDVDDAATATLMGHFYRQLLERGQAPAAALRLAQLAVRNDRRWAAPYYWAGFELQGDWRALP